MSEEYLSIRNNINMLAKMLGETIKDALGWEVLDRVETIRQLSKASHSGSHVDREKLLLMLQNLSNDELIPVAKAFNQILNFTNTAEQYHSISSHNIEAYKPADINNLFQRLHDQKKNKEEIERVINNLSIELVLTAHPTEINRRSIINKLIEVNYCLDELDHSDLSDYAENKIIRRLKQLVAQFWFTDEIRKTRPTPIDEAKWGFDVVENSLWSGVTTFLRELNETFQQSVNFMPSIEQVPIHFTSWMGGDRDGNPNVTASVTEHVLLLSRLRAAKLFLNDIQVLINELSMSHATEELQQLAGGIEVAEPYRAIMKQLRHQLFNTINYLEARIEGEELLPPKDLLSKNSQLWEPLYACYQSLIACNMRIVANGDLLDTLRRVKIFGLPLVRLDIRQDSARHMDVLSELTQYLELGDYATWNEEQKQAFLIKELNSKRPLIPHNWKPSLETQEVLDTCKVISQSTEESIACYVISMAKAPSDVLAVHLLLKEFDCPFILPVVPLFETLDDLNNAKAVMEALFVIPWYKNIIQNKQMVMIGYSDSAKDAGVMAASWAQYKAQEALVSLCEENNIELTLFHGRGGTNGRGGLPAHEALLSQPPGSLKGGFRVTEQGEMIRFKLGLPQVAIESLALYTSAVLEANLLPPPEPKAEWREIMEQLSTISCGKYREVVRDNPHFVDYFRSATPEQELGNLPLGSRPAKRRANGGIESLRAIPWIFAWMQNRLMLPAWLGAGSSIQQMIEEGKLNDLSAMSQQWPFFASRIGMLEMVFSKTDPWIAEYYDQRLVDKKLWSIGEQLRQQLKNDIHVVLQIAGDEKLMNKLPTIASSIALRNVYTDPLNLLQAELLHRSRQPETATSEVEQALMITISGIAAGMRNTG